MIVLCSGGFDPLHTGHIDYLHAARKHGAVIVALNSDDWLQRKKGYVFMPWKQRSSILSELRSVSTVIQVKDADGTVCEALEWLKPHFFANGGDRMEANPEEHAVCEKFGIRELFGVGGGKSLSSSDLVRRASDYYHAHTVQD